jgi:hypothetical protein
MTQDNQYRTDRSVPDADRERVDGAPSVDEDGVEIIYKKEKPILRLTIIVFGSMFTVAALLFLFGMITQLMGGRPPTVDPEVFRIQLEEVLGRISNGGESAPTSTTPPSELTPATKS